MSSTELLKLDEGVIECPQGDGRTITINLKKILEAEARMIEVQSVTKEKSAELLAAFNISWRDLHQNITYLEKARNDAERTLNTVRATIILERAPDILRERKLTNNEHHREAVIALDPEFQAAEEHMQFIEAVIALLKGKLKAFEMAYTSVKKLLGEDAFSWLNRNDHLTSGDGGNREVGVVDPDERPAQGTLHVNGFGKPRY